eukprot:CAMPEP_0182548144 /NCGR_PEP_ID=MMETSP1323-20130603/38408_1 /TAXON_ID=236787 /ORGANISM="Florenciella parvula, Strain RCC1693" /LENGTH=191 /DNA_ID=CAMNT_0024759513 /DNA_START=43 /DNA_END=615 /DNA_ORIENTATION=-
MQNVNVQNSNHPDRASPETAEPLEVRLQVALEERRVDRVVGEWVVERILGHVLDENVAVDVLQVGAQAAHGVRVRVQHEPDAARRLEVVQREPRGLDQVQPLGALRRAHVRDELLEREEHAEYELLVLVRRVLHVGERVERPVPLLVVHACALPVEDVEIEDHGGGRSARPGPRGRRGVWPGPHGGERTDG